VVTALCRKYAELKGVGDAEGMVHISGALRIFGSTVDLDALLPIRPYKPNRELWTRTGLAILRKSDRPMRVFELARMIMAELGVQPDDKRRMHSIVSALQGAFARLEDRGVMVSVGRPRQWSIPR